jgi:hypothetical protein
MPKNEFMKRTNIHILIEQDVNPTTMGLLKAPRLHAQRVCFQKEQYWRVKRWIMAGVLSLLCNLPLTSAYAENGQPVYVIAHRCNAGDMVRNVITKQKVNGIEADFRYGRPWPWGNESWFVDHDLVRPGSTRLDDWLTVVQSTLYPGSSLSLIVFDIKTPGGSLQELYSKVREKLGFDVNFIFSIGDFSQKEQFPQLITDAFKKDERAGAAIDYLSPSETQQQVKDFFTSKGINRYWFGDGLNAGMPTPNSVRVNVSAGINLRDADKSQFFHGVYTWTYENRGEIQNFLNQGVNGIMMNASECFGKIDSSAPDPIEIVNYVKSLGKKFASPADNPFSPPPSSGTSVPGSPTGITVN